jgi:glycosyltransferase involved in cell wall biosynthesis
MTSRLKLLQLLPRYDNQDSVAELGERILQGLPAERFDVVNAFLQGHPASAEPPAAGRRSVFFDFSDRQMKGLRIGVRRQLSRFCQAEQFDVVVVHRFKATHLFLHLNRRLHIRHCIGVCHGVGEYQRFYRRWQVRRAIDGCWQFVAVSPAVRDYLTGLQCGFTASNTLVISNALDVEQAERCQLPRATARIELGLPGDAFIFGSIGRLVPVKGHIYLLHAFAELAPENPGAFLAIIGEGRSRPQLMAAIDTLGLHARVFLLGAKEQAVRYVRAFDAFVMPSLSEGLPLALLEGMSGRLPVIASDIDSLRPILQGFGGRTFPPGDVRLLARQLRGVLEASREDRLQEGERGYAYLVREHSIEHFHQCYSALLAGDDVGHG